MPTRHAPIAALSPGVPESRPRVLRKRYPSLQTLQSFLQVVDAGSVSAAARRMALTHSAVSQHISALEAYVGCRLFQRHKRGVSPNRAGLQLANTLTTSLDQIDQTLTLLQTHDTPDQLTITVGSELAQGWFNARLPQLLQRLPDTRLTIRTGDGADYFQARPSGIALCYGYGEWTDREVAPVGKDTVVAVASPEFVTRHGITLPISPARLLELPLLGYTRRSWRLWLGAAGLEPEEPRAIASFDNVAHLLGAAEAGLGVGLSRRLLVVDRIRSGRLLILSPHAIPTQYNLYVTWPHHCADQAWPVVAAIRDLVRESLGAADSPASDGSTPAADTP